MFYVLYAAQTFYFTFFSAFIIPGKLEMLNPFPTFPVLFAETPLLRELQNSPMITPETAAVAKLSYISRIFSLGVLV